MVNYASDEDAYPERPQRVEGPLLNPTKDSCPACSDPVGEEHRETTEGSDLVGKNLSSQPISAANDALYFAASNSRTITRSTSSGCGSGSFNTSPPLTALNSTLLASRSSRTKRTGRGIPASASTG